MKLLLFSDLHRNQHAAQQIVEQSNEVDVVVGAGDLANVHEGLDEMIYILSRISCPTVLTPGNNETFEALQQACANWKAAHVLHGSGMTLLGQPFFGLGGGIPITPFGEWSYDFSEADAETLLADCPEGCVLVSHSPPKGTVDVSSGGQHLGSETVRNWIETKKPLLVVCGHIHESGGQQDQIADSPIVNAGPQGMIWEIETG